MVTAKDKEEIIQFINNKIHEFKRKSPFVALPILALIPSISSVASNIPQCAMNYTLKDILDFLIKAEQDGRIRK